MEYIFHILEETVWNMQEKINIHIKTCRIQYLQKGIDGKKQNILEKVGYNAKLILE